MNRFILIVCFLGLTLPATAWAQRKKSAAPAKPALTAEQLIQAYRFTEAANTLQREIDAARKTGKPTEQLEYDLRRANLGADLLRGTERITFVDSVKVPRSRMFQALRLSPEAGRLTLAEGEKAAMTAPPAQLGMGAYANELGDRLYFAAADKAQAAKTLRVAYRTGKKWGKPTVLDGMEDSTADQDFPFVMPDGVTLYYAAQGEGSLGGYDLFVTRYNPETKQYLKAENLGMPFNSPANDYLMAIDEGANLGWLVTDRNQQADTVCVYLFVPSETREVYELSDMNREEVVRAAQIHAITDTQTDKKQVANARIRLANLAQQSPTSANEKAARRYVINDETVYTDLNQFRSRAARRLAEQADEAAEQMARLTQKQDELQRAAAAGNRSQVVLDQLAQVNKLLPQLEKQYQTLCKEMRQAEAR